MYEIKTVIPNKYLSVLVDWIFDVINQVSVSDKFRKKIMCSYCTIWTINYFDFKPSKYQFAACLSFYFNDVIKDITYLSKITLNTYSHELIEDYIEKLKPIMRMNSFNTILNYSNINNLNIKVIENKLKNDKLIYTDPYNVIETLEREQLFNINQSCFDVVMREEIPIIEYVRDKNHMVFVFYDSKLTQTIRVGLEIEYFEKAMREKEHYIIYSCKIPNTLRPENIDTNNPYFDIKKLCGFGDLVELNEMTYILDFIHTNNSTNNIFVFKKSDIKLITTVSDDVLHNRTSYISARHCQTGQNANVYNLDKYVKFTQQEINEYSGGSNVKNTKKEKKYRKTIKNKKYIRRQKNKN